MDNKRLSSLEIYSICKEDMDQKQMGVKRNYANKVLFALWGEINEAHKKITEIDFIVAINKMITTAKQHRKIEESKIFMLDAYLFTKALYTCLEKNNYLENAISDENIPYMFEPNSFEYNNSIKCLEEIYKNINKIEKIVESRAIDSEPQMIKQSNARSIREKLNSNVASRREDNEKAVEEWHNEMDAIDSALKSLQPDVKKILEHIIGFSDKITEDYVLKFAQKQIELFDDITDGYLDHKEKLESSDNQDYVNAVMNYEDYLERIIDSLAVFGVEEISSNEGDSFDGKIHESVSRDFSSRNAIVRKSIRSGFKYNDIVIQKEKVEI